MPRPAPSRIAAALDYLQQLRDRAGGILNTVASTPGTLRPDEYQERFGLPGDPVPAPREVGRAVRGAATRFTSLDAPQNPTFAEMAAETGASFVPGVGQLLAARDIERARRADDLAGMAMAASNFLPVDRLISALRHGLGRPPISELDVYHGTPHTYAPTEANPLGEFDASKIGTGEGAQAYGHGIYYAENPDVAKGYADTLGGGRFEYAGEAITGDSPKRRAVELLWSHSGEKTGAIDDALNAGYDNGREIAREIKNLDFTKIKKGGSLYKADLPDEMIDRMLDWDKPLSEQSAAVREALMKNPAVAAEVKRINAQREALNAQDPRRLTHPVISKLAKKETTAESLKGQALYELLAKGGNQAETSAYLRSLGIPGIKYLDEGSRNTAGKWIAKHPMGGENAFNTEAELNAFLKRNPEMAAVKPKQTRNFVVFPGEEKKVRILERNGQPAPERIAQALEAAKPSKAQAKAGGEIAVSNGYFYKGGQFLPSTEATPGKWKIGKKTVTTGKELVAPGEFSVQPTPFSRSIYSGAGLRDYTVQTPEGLKIREGIRDALGNPITPESKVRLGVKGVLGKEELTMQEFVDAYNKGQRWFDVQPDAPVMRTK